MSGVIDRKAALRAYKERKVRPGIYGVRHLLTGRAWADSSLDLDTAKNGLWLRLNQGRHLDRRLQEAWNRFGEEAFEYVLLEVIEEELDPPFLRDALKAKKAEWANLLAASDEGFAAGR